MSADEIVLPNDNRRKRVGAAAQDSRCAPPPSPETGLGVREAVAEATTQRDA